MVGEGTEESALAKVRVVSSNLIARSKIFCQSQKHYHLAARMSGRLLMMPTARRRRGPARWSVSTFELAKIEQSMPVFQKYHYFLLIKVFKKKIMKSLLMSF